ncbi:hypothetical protein RE474_12405 [Methanolobus sediminis]|uniref:Uncharacterized protein n=1 Tax=Methanolobus sediminis TaxID=3072978 RepID=A0AA51YLT6_9EURY|nr:hypothetical protein [Methanolobus sediminis]WMW24868.1 hypothetical protein RE474_12405 [Methanolobus sediminis]
MVRFFSKKEEKTQLTDAEVAELIKSAYDLGFEVGYHKHSELGWVSERYSMLEDLAKTAGFDTLVKERYTKGKIEGLKAKERDMHVGLSKKEAEKERQESKVVHDTSVLYSANGCMDSGYGSSLVTDKSIAGMILQPSLMNMPESTSRTKVIDRPTQLRGFKPLYPKI